MSTRVNHTASVYWYQETIVIQRDNRTSDGVGISDSSVHQVQREPPEALGDAILRVLAPPPAIVERPKGKCEDPVAKMFGFRSSRALAKHAKHAFVTLGSESFVATGSMADAHGGYEAHGPEYVADKKDMRAIGVAILSALGIMGAAE